MGERAGNTRLAEVVAAIHDHSELRTGVVESRLAGISRMVETFSGKDVAPNAPIVGRDVFTQTGGIHADGDAKGDLYLSRLAPNRFGRARRYALGKLSGKASLEHNLEALGIELTAADRDRVLERIVELGDRKHIVSPEDLPYLIADLLKKPADRRVRVEDYRVFVASDEPPRAEVTLSYRGQTEKGEASGDGGYDAFMNAVKKAVKPWGLEVPRLTDYRVRIPPGGRTGALVETVITWKRETPAKKRARPMADETFATMGVDSDQLASAVLASEKMLNAISAPRVAKRKKKKASA
jgi:D-citramalate synthase